MDKSNLTSRQREVLSLREQGLSCMDIAKKLQCSKQNVYGVIASANKRMAREIVQDVSEKKQNKKKAYDQYNYAMYNDRDFSCLSEMERLCMSCKISGMTYRQISEEKGVSISSVGVLLKRAREKLNGTYDRVAIAEASKKNRVKLGKEIVSERNKKSYLKNREERIKNMKEYNKIYYQKHREEILSRQKEKLKRERRDNDLP